MVKDVDSTKDTGVYITKKAIDRAESCTISWGIKATVAFGHAICLRGTRPNWGATAAMAFMASVKFLPWYTRLFVKKRPADPPAGP